MQNIWRVRLGLPRFYINMLIFIVRCKLPLLPLCSAQLVTCAAQRPVRGALEAWQMTLPVYNCQWTRGALNLDFPLGNTTVIWAGTLLWRTNGVQHVNSVWKFPGKSEFRGRALERVNRIPSFIRPFPEAISERGKPELRYFLIRRICLNALLYGKIL